MVESLIETTKALIQTLKKRFSAFLEKIREKIHSSEKLNILKASVQNKLNDIKLPNNKWLNKPMIIMVGSLALLFALIFSYQAFSRYMTSKYMAAQFLQPVTISAIKAKYEEWQPKLKAAGSLRAVQGVDITPELAGLVRNILFTPGMNVKMNDIIIELNFDTDMAQLQALEATAELAKITYIRDKAQFDIKAVSQATLDTDAAQLKNIYAQVAEQAAVVAKKIIRAPFDGRLGISAVNPGQYLNPGDKIVTLQSLNPIYVDFYLPQQVIMQVKVGQSVTLKMDSYPNCIFTGKISTIDPKIDPATRNIQVEATIDNPNHQLLPGMFATVEVDAGAPQKHLTLPQTAISFNPYGEIVFLIQESGKDNKGNPILKAKQSFVTVGETRGDQIAILKGLKEGDWVANGGQLKLKNGSIVVINNDITPSNNPNPQVENE